MPSEERNCRNCRTEFTIESEDFNFYERIQVPPPTWCPDCRQMRRMVFRAERNLFKRKDDRTGKDIISVYSSDSPYKIYDYGYWYSDEFDPMQYGREYDFSRPFFEQFNDFMHAIPWPSLRVESSENCEYNNDVSRSKNCYLCTRTHQSSDMTYVYRGNKSRNCVDCYQVFMGSEFLYESIECVSSTNGRYLYFSENCSNSDFLYDCRNCLDCFMCSNLRNKQYCFKNRQYTKEEYQQKIKEYNLGSHQLREQALREFEEFLKGAIRKNLNILKSVNCTGDNILECKDARLSFNVKRSEKMKNVWDVQGYKDSMDAYSGGASELVYECTATTDSYACNFCVRAKNCNNVDYSIFINNSRNIFGCIGLENKEYCILNKQYTPEEFRELRAKIVRHMTETGEHGEFFPMTLSTFPYNNTVAHEYFPKTKEDAVSSGLRWNDPDTKNYTVTMAPDQIPDDIRYVNEEILKETIGCVHAGKCAHGCTTAFRVIPRELEFYKRMNLALPRLCPNCRHYGRLGKLNPPKLWPGKCQCAGTKSDNGLYENAAVHHLHGNDHCPNEFETSYAPDRPEIVYCEKCYQQEVY